MALSKFSSRNCEFFEQTLKDLDCPICFQIPWSPFLTACCGNHLCEACVKATKEKRNRRCPFCNKKPISGIIDKKFQRQINELQVYCLHKALGCLWVGALSKLTKHLGEGKIDGECKFVSLSCTSSCGKQIFRCELEEHLSEECPLRTYACEYCGYSSTYDDITTKHYSNCPDYPMACPNLCSEEKIKNSNLDQHLLTCPDEIISCSFNEIGCEERIKRRCLQQHIKANVMQHQLMMYDAFKSVKKENDALKDDIRILKQKNDELQKNDVALKCAQIRMDHMTVGFVLKMAENIKADKWEEYFSSLATISTDTLDCVSPVIIKWPDYSEVKQIAKESSVVGGKYYYTRPFYTHPDGYKMQLCIWPYRENSISVYCHLMRGENDDHLKWPFIGSVTITLLNQRADSEHITKRLRYNGSAELANTVKKPESDKIRNSAGWGCRNFISVSEVESSTAQRQYLMNDALYFKISTSLRSNLFS